MGEPPADFAADVVLRDDQALFVLDDQLAVDARLVVEAVQVGACRELEQVAIALCFHAYDRASCPFTIP